jgi:Sulfotransferase family
MQSDATSPRRTAVFFHIMKTGGMTFRRILASIYGDGFHLVEDPSVEAIENALQRYECIEFHMRPYRGDFIHMHTELARQRRWDVLAGTDVFTMLREPVDQVVSQYFYMVEQRAIIEPAYKANGTRFPESIDEYLDHPAHLNNQLAFLAAKYQLKPGNDISRADLDNVKATLLQLGAHPGLTERFAESLHIFESVTGRRLASGQVLNQNANPNRLPLEAISPKVKDRIRELSALDIELYHFAQQMFENDLAKCGPAREYSFVKV